MFTVRVQDARDAIVQCNETLKNSSEIFTVGCLEGMNREIANKLTDIQTLFDKLVSDNAILVSSRVVSESFALKKGSFEVVKTAGNKLLRKIELLKEADMIDLFAPYERNPSPSFPPRSEVLPPRAPEFSAGHGTSSEGFPDLYRSRSFSLDLPEESAPLSFPADGAAPPPSMVFTPLLVAAGSIGDLPAPLVLGGASVASVSIDDRSVNIQSQGKRKIQNPLSVQTTVPLPLGLDPSIAANRKKHRIALRLQKSKDQLLVKPAVSLSEYERSQILTRLQAMLHDIPEDLRVLTSEEEVKFGIAFGSEEYVRYTEMQELKKLGNHSVQVQLIERKINRGLQGIRGNF
jgi:hypothetical protein